MEYTSNIDDISQVRKQVKVSIPLEFFRGEMKKSLDSVSRKASIKGFRPGKAPQQLIQKMYGERVRLETIDKLVNDSLQEIIKKNSFSLLGDPEVDLKGVEADAPIEYTATFSIFPKPEVSGYDSFEISVEKREALDEEVEAVVQSVLRSKATLARVEDREIIEKGDIVEGEVATTLAGAESEGRSEPFYIKVGEGRVPEAIEDGLVGMKLGETKSIESTLSEQHPDASLKGAGVVYKMTPRSISTEVLPELTDDFVKVLEGPEQTVLELKIAIRTRLDRDYENMAHEEVKSRIIAQLVDAHDFEIPAELVEDEIKSLVAQRNSGKAGDENITDEAREEFTDEGRRRVKAAILIDRIAEKESLHAKSEDIEKHMQEMAAAYGVGIDDVRKFFGKEGRLVGVFIELTRRKVLDFLAERAKVSFEPAKAASEHAAKAG